MAVLSLDVQSMVARRQSRHKTEGNELKYVQISLCTCGRIPEGRVSASLVLPAWLWMLFLPVAVSQCCCLRPTLGAFFNSALLVESRLVCRSNIPHCESVAGATFAGWTHPSLRLPGWSIPGLSPDCFLCLCCEMKLGNVKNSKIKSLNLTTGEVCEMLLGLTRYQLSVCAGGGEGSQFYVGQGQGVDHLVLFLLWIFFDTQEQFSRSAAVMASGSRHGFG